MGANIVDTLEDGLHLALCGAGGPLPAPNASGPCVAVVAGKKLFMVDSGSDGIRNLGRMGYQPGTIQGVFLTHFHSDHIDALGETGTIRWAGGDNTEPLPVYGPRGVERVVDGFNAAYSQDFIYRNKHHGDTVALLSGAGLTAMPFTMPAMGELETVYSDGELTVEALAVDHSPVEPAVGYRFRYKGRSLLITGDTVKLANITHDILDYHASPVDAAETARDAGVGHLLYYHIVPPLIIPGQKTLYLNGAEDIFPDYTIGQDGVSFSLPAGSDEIILTREGL